MINRATDLVEAGRYRSPFGYIMVDEFQDISPPRARLLKALLVRSPNAQLFAVGDDWQAIYRFGGSDISVMREFGGHFGDYGRVDLETTHMFGSGLDDAAGRRRRHRRQRRVIAFIEVADQGRGLRLGGRGEGERAEEHDQRRGGAEKRAPRDTLAHETRRPASGCNLYGGAAGPAGRPPVRRRWQAAPLPRPRRTRGLGSRCSAVL